MSDRAWLACELTFSDGRVVRYAHDEENVENNPSGIEFSSQIPGGWDTGSVTLPRPPRLRSDDALLYARARIYGPGGRTAYIGRVVGVSQVGSDEVRLELEGLIAHLADDESFREIYMDRDLSRWGEPSVARQEDLALGLIKRNIDGNTNTGTPTGISFHITELETGVTDAGELWYYGEGVDIGEFVYDFESTAGAGASWLTQAFLSSDDVFTSSDAGTNHGQAITLNQSLAATVDGRKYAIVAAQYSGAATGEFDAYQWWLNIAILGRQGLTLRGTWPDVGFYGSDILRHALAKWAPLLPFSDESIEESFFVIPHAVFLDRSGTVRSVAEFVTGFGGATTEPPDWGCYEEFFWRTPGTYGRKWRVRRDEVAEPTDEGPDGRERVTGIQVEYQEGGRTKTVGPPGSNADTETELLEDLDPNNPATNLGAPKIKTKNAGITNEEGAILLGRLWLRDQNRQDRRGSVAIQGEARDENGNPHPPWAVRAGDTLVIEEDEGSTEQPISSTSYSDDAYSVNVSVGAVSDTAEVLFAQLEARTRE